MKGTLSEMKLTTLRQRAYEAEMQKARRGELFMMVAIGYVRVGKDCIAPGASVRPSAWCSANSVARQGPSILWRLPVYHTVHGILCNPLYAGAYVFGRTNPHAHRAGPQEKHRRASGGVERLANLHPPPSRRIYFLGGV